jgi:predicted GH43/DUF377 family glycosyl hydrolase
MEAFKLRRICTIMEPEPENELEAKGVLNPAAVRGPDGALYLFPRLVAKGNYSRIGIAKVHFNKDGNPEAVERLGIALEPTADYEKRPDGGGCEDARITYVEPLKHYLMTYTAFSADGPRIAMAQSKDLFKWEKLGLVSYLPYDGIEFNGVDNKDASLFPIDIPSPHGHKSIAMLSRPLFPDTRPEERMQHQKNRKIDAHLESIWISYCNLKHENDATYHNAKFTSHHCLANPVFSWERLKIGAGTPPVLTRFGWMILYHGVHELRKSAKGRKLCYSAGLMILSEKDPSKIVYRSVQPILKPALPAEKVGAIANVVFPTGIDCRHDLNKPDRFDVYYGMADDRIGVATMHLPRTLPTGTKEAR